MLLISCLGERTDGGLFAYDCNAMEQLDTLSSTGLAVDDGRLGRLLWSSGEAGSVGELLVYDQKGVERYLRIDALREPHDLMWDGHQLVAVSTMSNSILWISPAGEVTRTWRAEGDGDARERTVSKIGPPRPAIASSGVHGLTLSRTRPPQFPTTGAHQR